MYRDDLTLEFTFCATETRAAQPRRVQLRVPYEHIYSLTDDYAIVEYITNRMARELVAIMHESNTPDIGSEMVSDALAHTFNVSERPVEQETKLTSKKKERNTTRIVRFRQGAKNEIDFTGHRATRAAKEGAQQSAPTTRVAKASLNT